ncbi:hypothetical protein [Pleionea sp. CnH1-48]|uniref:hypothetical protein n=1 Tax=Pleionea sp. CnH1-48 TaxID=2954494 RepID=UPI0020969994|nr:hypothetical protein [Pleionea sp. CnH1-48]MCO7223298.1 hypothetical protein [Pleionea sp. CnH1-48]
MFGVTKKSLLIVILFVIAIKGYANEYITCNSCKSQPEFYSKMYSKAENLVTAHGYNGDIFVANFQDAKVYAWRVSAFYRFSDFDDDPQVHIRSYLINVPGDISYSVNGIANSSLMKNLLSQDVEVPFSRFESAWDLARTSYLRKELNDWFFETHQVQSRANSVILMFGSAFNSELSGIKVRFVFADGSSILMEASKLNDNKYFFTYVPGSAIDKDDNKIPEPGDPIVGNNYGFDTLAALYDFMNRADRYYNFRYNLVNTGGGKYKKYFVTVSRE